MKITRVEAIPVRVPLRAGLTTKTAHGEHVDSPYVVVRLHADNGLIGLGEATVSPRWSGETSPGAVAVIRDLLAPVLIGSDPADINALRQRMQREIRFNPFTKAGVEMALWDLAGQQAGVPVWKLLGGQSPGPLRVKPVVGAFPTPQAVALAQRFLDAGATCLKVKVGLDAERDLERVRAIRELAGPALELGVDANGGWSFEVAQTMLGRLAPLNLAFVEQPIMPRDVHELARLRATSPIPIMADESLFSVNDAHRLAAAHGADIWSIYPGKHGGIAATVEVVKLARGVGVACALGSNLELGIGTAALLHVAAALAPQDTERIPGDFIGTLYHDADLLQQPLDINFQRAIVPVGPGLGVTLDPEQLARYAERLD